MSKFNKKSVGTKTINRAGGKAYSMSSKSELISLVLCSFLSDKFYESEADQKMRLINLVENLPAQFVSNLAVYARREFHMRSVSHVLVAELARLHKGDSLVSDTILEVAERPDDLMEIVSYYGNNYGKPLPNGMKKGIARALKIFNQYQLTKYKGNGKDVKLFDLFNIAHPKGTPEQMEMWGKLLSGKLEAPETWEVLISTAKDKVEATQRWEKLIMEDKIGYMALLRNLRNFEKYGISPDVAKKVCSKLTDPERVKKSKQLPFRFFQAYKNAPTTQFKDAVSEALDISIDNVPKFDGKTLVCVDTSGSMSSTLSEKGDTRKIDIAALFGCALFKANPHNVEIFGFDSEVRKYTFSSRVPTVDLMPTINTPGGSTNLYLVFEVLTKEKFIYDRIIILSDFQAYGDHGVNESFHRYCKEIGTRPIIHSVDLSGYGTLQSPAPNIYFEAGWSEKIFTLMKIFEDSPDSLVSLIENYEISKKDGVHSDSDDSGNA